MRLEDLRCPECGKPPGAASSKGGEDWEMDYCEECGYPHEEDSLPIDPLDVELPDDPDAYREEMRRLHESQV